jgi:hypothetical protein
MRDLLRFFTPLVEGGDVKLLFLLPDFPGVSNFRFLLEEGDCDWVKDSFFKTSGESAERCCKNSNFINNITSPTTKSRETHRLVEIIKHKKLEMDQLHITFSVVYCCKVFIRF